MKVEFTLKNGEKILVGNIDYATFGEFANSCFPPHGFVPGLIIFNDIAINREEIVMFKRV